MKKSITISIPEPCHEDWGKMTATEKGKFCKVCTKEVIDFTKESDEALIKRVQKGDNLCGRFKTSQLNRQMTLERKSRNSILPYAASLLLPLSLLGHQEAKAQGGVSVFSKPGASINVGVLSEKSIVTITGQVTDEAGNPISGVEVLVLETGKNTLTNAQGNYRIQSPSGATLAFLHEEKQPYEVTVGTKNSVIHAVLSSEELLMPDHFILGRIAPPEEIEEIEEIEVIEKGEVKTIEEEIDEEENEIDKIVTRGTITDETGLPMLGVQVQLEGTEIGTFTDFNGNYEIASEANQTLVFSYIGYDTREITLANISNRIDMSLEPSNDLMGEIVIVGMMVATPVEELVESPLEREASWDNEQWENQRERQEYVAKENAYKKVQQERAKEARKKRRANKRKK
ncbi:carboxypeptidase-like regulatory domain-containing protein [Aureisphaera galaxeae]|uniref:carboxypeptidase-like regulatory domain-containing protein n=1 Tax=Aureisphaera galaxeae TaxID=1538023 RepID=UPI0023506B41|nr:carboxypeptidase-like regulatory domain-containing protein [Aureisphaera galaxeae]MDC8004921.1 carboxypeptidase-like regulatory domain-containing protein [Aureisphaera galaxeae]